jgi:hypothetical protein
VLDLEALALSQGAAQVIVLTYTPPDRVDAYSYGLTPQDTVEAHESLNRIKRFLDWPEEECQVLPVLDPS